MLNLFTKGHYNMGMFSQHHLEALLLSLIASVILLLIPLFLKNRKGYQRFLGFFVIAIKLVDILYRIYIEKFPFYQNLPMQLCNVAIFIGAFYLLTNSKYLFNMLYYWSYAALVVLIVPGSFTYTTSFYIFLFMFTHAVEIVILLYVKMYVPDRPQITFSGLVVTIVFYFLLVVNALYWNRLWGTNFMYVNDYILGFLSFIPFTIYLVLFISVNILAMAIMYSIRKIMNKR